MPPPHRPLSQSHHPNNKICQQPPTPPSLPAQTDLLHPPPSPHPQKFLHLKSPTFANLPTTPPHLVNPFFARCAKSCRIPSHPFSGNFTRVFTRVLHLTYAHSAFHYLCLAYVHLKSLLLQSGHPLC